MPKHTKIAFWGIKEDLCLPTRYAVDEDGEIHTCLGLCMAALPDERSVVVGTLGEHLLLWNLTKQDLPDGKLIGRFSALRLTLSPDKRTLVVGTYDGNIFFLRIGTWECQRAITLEDGHNVYSFLVKGGGGIARFLLFRWIMSSL
jgi:WD40 repeat protein